MNYPDVYAPVFNRLKGLHVEGDGWGAFCPRCEPDGGKSKSLSLKLGGGGKLLIRCHSPSACPVEAVAEAIGLGVEHLFPDAGRLERDRSELNFVCAYDYRDVERKLLFQVLRWVHKETGAKTFSQRRPNPDYDPSGPDTRDNPRWLRGVAGVPLVLYRLPELLEAIHQRPDRWVWVVEGEKAVDTVRALGLTAVTNPMGAGKWRSEYALTLTGCNVAVVPDADPADSQTGRAKGFDHALDVCRSCYGLAKEVRMVELPVVPGSKDGLDDWIGGAGPGWIRELRDLLEAAPAYEPWPGCPVPLQKIGAEWFRRMPTHAGRTDQHQLMGRLREAYLNTEEALRCFDDQPGAAAVLGAVALDIITACEGLV